MVGIMAIGLTIMLLTPAGDRPLLFYPTTQEFEPNSALPSLSHQRRDGGIERRRARHTHVNRLERVIVVGRAMQRELCARSRTTRAPRQHRSVTRLTNLPRRGSVRTARPRNPDKPRFDIRQRHPAV